MAGKVIKMKVSAKIPPLLIHETVRRQSLRSCVRVAAAAPLFALSLKSLRQTLTVILKRPREDSKLMVIRYAFDYLQNNIGFLASVQEIEVKSQILYFS